MSVILRSDSYKFSQFNQYPPNTEAVFSYIESRGGRYPKTLFFGLQAFIEEYLTKPITMEDIDEAEELILAHGEPFNRAGWEYILNEYLGYLPVAIHALPEGTLAPTGTALVTIQNTDPNCYWLPSFLETTLLRAVWYPTTVATNSYYARQLILEALEMTGDPSLIDFKLHDFGARGVSSGESAGIGAAAHLVNFKGTDTVEGLLFARKFYGTKMAGFSVPAMEHSTVTSWGRENEVKAYRNMVKQNGKPGGIISCVSDSYDIYEACRLWGTELKQDVLDSGATLVVRPDSGDPVTVVLECLDILSKHFGFERNSKGYKVLNNVRVLQGDGIDYDTIKNILGHAADADYSADNLVFGQGGGLLQIVNRDDQKFAMKCSAALVDGMWIDVYKDPITDPGKTSKKGRLKTILDDGVITTVRNEEPGNSLLEMVFLDGEVTRFQSFDRIREIAQCY